MGVDENWRDGPSNVEEFYGKPLSRELASVIAATPTEQIEGLLSGLRRVRPKGGWPQMGAPLTKLEAGRRVVSRRTASTRTGAADGVVAAFGRIRRANCCCRSFGASETGRPADVTCGRRVERG
jgi:hypothetical protein